jgi:hypothetical protein
MVISTARGVFCLFAIGAASVGLPGCERRSGEGGLPRGGQETPMGHSKDPSLSLDGVSLPTYTGSENLRAIGGRKAHPNDKPPFGGSTSDEIVDQGKAKNRGERVSPSKSLLGRQGFDVIWGTDREGTPPLLLDETGELLETDPDQNRIDPPSALGERPKHAIPGLKGWMGFEPEGNSDIKVVEPKPNVLGAQPPQIQSPSEPRTPRIDTVEPSEKPPTIPIDIPNPLKNSQKPRIPGPLPQARSTDSSPR